MTGVQTCALPIWKTGDCVIRALACALSESWEEVFKEVADEAFRTRRSMVDPKVFTNILDNHGFDLIRIKPEKGSKRPTPKSLIERYRYSGREYVIVVEVCKHLTAIRDWKVWDTWDCSERAAYRYWIKEAPGEDLRETIG